MEKDFLEVFFGLEVEKELKALLEDVKVTKIAVNPKKDRMRAYSGFRKNTSMLWKSR